MYSASPRFARPSRQEQVPSSHRADDLQVNIIVLLIVINELSKSFGRGVGTTLGLIFLGFIFLAHPRFRIRTVSGWRSSRCLIRHQKTPFKPSPVETFHRAISFPDHTGNHRF